MDKERLVFSSKTIELSEHSTYLELTNLVCYLDYPNLNSVQLLSNDIDEFRDTLKDMPMVAYYMRHPETDEPTFRGHEVSIDEEGDVVFNTTAIGTHIETYVEDATVDVLGEMKTVPCLFAKSKIWKRNKNVISAIRRLYEEEKLYSSWEIETYGYEYKDGIKTLTNYSFIGNCLLGGDNNVFPAYGKNAGVISISQFSDSQLLVAEALAKDLQVSDINDLNDIQKKEDKTVKKNKKEISAVTMRDLYKKLEQAVENKMDYWMYVSMIFPEDHKLWAYKWDRESELDFYEFTYTVSEDDMVEVSEPKEVKLTMTYASEDKNVNIQVQLDETAKLLSQKETKITELTNKVEKLENDLSEKNDAIIKATEKLETLENEVSELKPYKDKVEQAEKKESIKKLALDSKCITSEELETSETLKEMINNLDEDGIKTEISTRKREELKKFALKGGYITKEELETSEDLKTMIEEVDEKGIKAEIAERVIKKLEENSSVNTSQNKTEEVETETATANISSEEDEPINKSTFMSDWLKGRQ